MIGLTHVESNTKIKNNGVKSNGAKSKPVKYEKLLKFFKLGVAT
tara:strand:- start:1632 stop:1763 length:132 start_codon:yes stop_codon:yes gene_type:complete